MFIKLNKVYKNEPEKRKNIIMELKKYTDSGDMKALTTNLNNVLKNPQERMLLDEIKRFIPIRDQALFDSLIENSTSQNNRGNINSGTSNNNNTLNSNISQQIKRPSVAPNIKIGNLVPSIYNSKSRESIANNINGKNQGAKENNATNNFVYSTPKTFDTNNERNDKINENNKEFMNSSISTDSNRYQTIQSNHSLKIPSGKRYSDN